MNAVSEGIRLIDGINMQKPISVSAFGLFVKNRIHDFRFHLVQTIGLHNVNKVGADFGSGFIFFQIAEKRKIIRQAYKTDIFILYFTSKIPAIHGQEK
jgi:hypothetical protein